MSEESKEIEKNKDLETEVDASKINLAKRMIIKRLTEKFKLEKDNIGGHIVKCRDTVHADHWKWLEKRKVEFTRAGLLGYPKETWYVNFVPVLDNKNLESIASGELILCKTNKKEPWVFGRVTDVEWQEGNDWLTVKSLLPGGQTKALAFEDDNEFAIPVAIG